MSRTNWLKRFIVLGFLVLVGYWLARAIYWKSFMGIILAITSLLAAVYFFFILAGVKEKMRSEDSVNSLD